MLKVHENMLLLPYFLVWWCNATVLLSHSSKQSPEVQPFLIGSTKTGWYEFRSNLIDNICRKFCCICTDCYPPSWLGLCRSTLCGNAVNGKHPGPERTCRRSIQGQYHCITLCLTYACVHCPSIVCICSMYVFNVHECCVHVIVPD